MADILRRTRITFVHGTVSGVDLENHRVNVVDAGTHRTQPVGYDYLMVAVGSETALD